MKERFYILLDVWYFDEIGYRYEWDTYSYNLQIDSKTINPEDRHWDYHFYKKQIEVSTYREFEADNKDYAPTKKTKLIEIDDDYLYVDHIGGLSLDDRKYSWKSYRLWEKTNSECYYNFYKKNRWQFKDDGYWLFTKSVDRDLKLKELL